MQVELCWIYNRLELLNELSNGLTIDCNNYKIKITLEAVSKVTLSPVLDIYMYIFDQVVLVVKVFLLVLNNSRNEKTVERLWAKHAVNEKCGHNQPLPNTRIQVIDNIIYVKTTYCLKCAISFWRGVTSLRVMRRDVLGFVCLSMNLLYTSLELAPRMLAWWHDVLSFSCGSLFIVWIIFVLWFICFYLPCYLLDHSGQEILLDLPWRNKQKDKYIHY